MKVKSFFLWAIILVMFSACGRYDDGPDFSLRSKKDRLSGLWQMQSLYQDGNDVSSNYSDLINSTQYGFYGDGNGIYFFRGWETYYKWSFVDNKTKIKLSFTLPDNQIKENYWTILRLTNQELWVSIDDTLGYDEMHFIKLED